MAPKRISNETKVVPEPKKAKLMFTDTSEEVANNRNKTLHEAALHGDLYTLKELLKEGANVHDLNDEKMTSLHLAAENGHVEIVTELLKYYAVAN